MTQQAATWIGLILTAAIAIGGVLQARRANQHSRDAVLLARSAEERADRLERQQLERRDVAWTFSWDRSTATVSARNVGTDQAHRVALVVRTRSPEGAVENQLRSVQPGEAIGARIGPQLAANRGSWKGATGHIVPSLPVHARVTWESESGVPGVDVWDQQV